MILAILAWLTLHFGGGSLKPFSLPLDQAAAQVKTHVSDPVRCRAALAILKDMEAVDLEWSAARQPKADALLHLANDRATRQQDIERFLADTRVQADLVQARFLELRFRLKDQLTREEWAIIFPAPVPHVPAGNR